MKVVLIASVRYIINLIYSFFYTMDGQLKVIKGSIFET